AGKPAILTPLGFIGLVEGSAEDFNDINYSCLSPKGHHAHCLFRRRSATSADCRNGFQLADPGRERFTGGAGNDSDGGRS
ncbi:MAG TPA: hypothetical protein VLZ81_13135, partial [Blastocatellia bacterium]|nr:hypothetical protein [Blastocatellia bacterium]